MAGLANMTTLAGESAGEEFLVFTLGSEEYGIDILKVQEIRGYDQVTRIANTPAFIRHSAPNLGINSTVSIAENINDGLVNRIEVRYLR